MYSERRWLLAIVMSVMLAVTMLFNPTFVMAADGDGGDGEDGDSTVTFVNSDGSEIEALVTEDGFVYEEVNSDGTDMVKILGYTGGKSVITVPGKINGAKVMSFAIDPRNPGLEGVSYDNVTKIQLPAYIEYAHTDYMKYFKSLRAVTVHSSNEFYKAEDGVLFKVRTDGKEGYKVDLYPRGKTDTSWVMPDYVTKPYTFFKDCPIEDLTLSASLDMAGKSGYSCFYRLKNLKNIYVSDGNTTLSSINGILTSKDQKTMIFYPMGRDSEEFTVPASITKLAAHSLRSDILKKIVLPANIQGVARGTIDYCWLLNTVEFTGKKAPDSAFAFEGLKRALAGDPEDESKIETVIPTDADQASYDAFFAELNSEAFARIPDNCEDIDLNEEKEVDITEGGQVVTFAFTPEEDGDYYFESVGNESDTVGCVLTEDEFIDSNDDYEGSDFKVFFHGVAGTTYYLQAKLYSSDKTGSFVVRTAAGTEGFAAIPDNPEVLKLNRRHVVEMTEGGQVATFAFTPASGGEYTYSVYDKTENLMINNYFRSNNDSWFFDKDKGSSENSVYFEAEGGQTYYFQTRIANNETGSYEIEVRPWGEDHLGFDAIPENPEEIALDEEKEVNITEAGQVATFAFTPTEDGDYYFESIGSGDTQGCVMTEDALIAVNDDSPETADRNFRIYFHGIAGTTYYLQAKLYNDEEEGAFTVHTAKGLPGFAPIPTEMEAIHTGDQKEVVVSTGGQVDTFVFTPEKTGEYVLTITSESEDAEACVCILRDRYTITSKREPLDSELMLLSEEDGETYYIQTKFYDSTMTGKYIVSLTEQKPFECDEHSLVYEDEVEATCYASGHIGYWVCTNCGKMFDSDGNDGKELSWEDIETPFKHSLVHVPAKQETCTVDGNIEHWECEICGRLFADEQGTNELEFYDVRIDATGHKLTKTPAKTVTCEADGNIAYWTCDVCGQICKDKYGDVEIDIADTVIKSAGHSWDKGVVTEGSCTEGGSILYTCEECGATKTEELAAAGHNLKHIKASEPTCTKDGSEEYWLCRTCGKLFADAEGTTETTEKDVIKEAPGHDWNEGEEITPATCNEDGEILFTCQNDPSHTKIKPIPAHHSLVPVEAKEKTCTDDGNIAYWECSECGMLFADAEGLAEIDQADVVIPAGHTLKPVAAKDPTCTEEGNVACWQCEVCQEYFADAAGETALADSDRILPVVDHDWGEPVYTWAEDNKSVTATRYCSYDTDQKHPETETVSVTEETVDSTCEKEGVTTYTPAAFSNPAFAVQPKTVVIDKKAHTPKDAVEENRVDSTCQTEGSYDSVVYCGVCGAEISREAKTIPTTAHNWSEPTYEWTPDGKACLATAVCQNGTTHTVSEAGKITSKVKTAATYTSKGTTTYTATFENEPFVQQTKNVQDIAKKQKLANPMRIKAVKKTVKAKTLKKKAVVVKGAVKFTKAAKGTKTYKGVGTNAKSKKALRISTKNGNITVKKKTKKGTYKMKVTVRAAGTSKGSPQYKPLSKTVTVTIVVK